LHKKQQKKYLKEKAEVFIICSTAGIKGFANSSFFAIGKFGLRGLTQSLARELHLQNIQVGPFVIDGGIERESYGYYEMIYSDSIAKSYIQFYNQDPSAWSWKIELRTSKEKF